MRVIAVKTIRQFWGKNPKSKQALLSWYEEAENAEWANHHQLKEQFRTASVLSSKRVVFNIHGNTFRLIVDIEYSLKIVFIVWIGSHVEYDKIDAKTIRYVKTN